MKRQLVRGALVLGHTMVDKLTGQYDKRVYAIDVNSNTVAPDTGTPRAALMRYRSCRFRTDA